MKKHARGDGIPDLGIRHPIFDASETSSDLSIAVITAPSKQKATVVIDGRLEEVWSLSTPDLIECCLSYFAVTLIVVFTLSELTESVSVIVCSPTVQNL